MKKILVVTTGGTIFQKEINGRMEIAVKPEELLQKLDFKCEVNVKEVSARSGAEMTFKTLYEISEIFNKSHGYDGFVLITGTDSMEEVAFSLDLIHTNDKPIVVCGAMKPSDVLGYDGLANFNDAVKVSICDDAKKTGVLVVMNDNIHPAKYVRKRDSALIGSFTSYPGPIGQIRCGQPIFYYNNLPDNKHKLSWANYSKADNMNIPIWTMSMGPNFIDDVFLSNCDGLIISGMGTGSISEQLISTLSPKWTNKIPIILSTRCWEGLSYDDFYYKGSRTKYENYGFKIIGYEDLNPLQARIKLILELSK